MTFSSLPSRSVAVILPAAGSGQRFGHHRNKLFAELAGKPLWVHAVERFGSRPEVGRILLVVSETDRELFQGHDSSMNLSQDLELVTGGAQRSDSVAAGLSSLDDSTVSNETIQWVAIHDAARPLLRNSDVTAVFDMAAQTRAATLAAPVSGTLKREVRRTAPQTNQTKPDAPNTMSSLTVERDGMWVALTPQVFQLELLRQAYARHRGRPATDDAQLVERTGHDVAIVPGSADNLKITYPEDLRVAEALLHEHDFD